MQEDLDLKVIFKHIAIQGYVRLASKKIKGKTFWNRETTM